MPWMLFDVAEVDEVEQRSSGSENGVIKFTAFLIHEALRLHKGRCAFEILLEEHRRIDAAWPALQDRRTIFQKRHELIANQQVVAQQVIFGELLSRPVDSFERSY